MSKWIRIAVSIILIVALLTFVADVREIWDTLQLLDLRWATLGLILLTVDRLLMTFKWLLLLAVRGWRLPLLDATRLYCSAMVWGLALPSTVGADAVRTTLLMRRGVPLADALGSIVVERAIGFLVAIALALASLVVLQETWEAASRWRPLLVLCAAVACGGGLLLAFSFSRRAFAAFRRAVPSRWRDSALVRRLERLHEAYRSLGMQRPAILAFTLLTVAEQLIAVPFTWAMARALAIEVPVLVLLVVMPLALLLARLPASFDGIGVFEGIFVALMGHAGIMPAQSLAIAVASRVLNLLALLPWWLAHGVFRRGAEPIATAAAAGGTGAAGGPDGGIHLPPE